MKTTFSELKRSGRMRELRHQLALGLLGALVLSFSSLAHSAELTVSAAASLRDAFTEIAREFERASPGSKVHLNFAASDQLLQQIAKGAPVDVFASADAQSMSRAEKQGLIDPKTRTDFARNTLVVVVPADSALQIRSLNDLGQPGIKRIAIGNPASVPAGRYAQHALQAANVWKAVESRVLNATNVRQALDYVARGEVDAALVYRTDAQSKANAVRSVLEVPTTEPVVYPIAVTKDSKATTEARAFVVFVRSDAGQRTLAKFHFQRP